MEQVTAAILIAFSCANFSLAACSIRCYSISNCRFFSAAGPHDARRTRL